MIGLRRATLGWLRAVIAPNLVLGVLAVSLVLVALGCLVFHYTVTGPMAAALSNYSEALVGYSMAVSALATLYGLMRGIGFHPALDYRYHEWLQATPWAPGAPLPKGPITPVWQDGVLLTLATLLTTAYAGEMAEPAAAALGPTIGMAAGLAVAWTLANFVTRNLVAVYAAAITVPAVWLLLRDLASAALAAGLVTAAGVAYAGVVYDLKRYPWQVFPRDKFYLRRLLNPHDQRQVNWQQTAAVGWPYTQLLKAPKGMRVSAGRAAMEAAIAGLWLATFGMGLQGRNDEAVWVFAIQAGVFLSIGKLVSNSLLMCPKLCLGERVARGRPIVWRHDRLLLEPLVVAAAMGFVGWLWVKYDPGPSAYGAGAMLAVGVYVCRRIGRPVAERFYAGSQMVAGVAPQPAFFKRLASPGE